MKYCIGRISGEDSALTGASRTDSGAHALGQVADFATDNPMPAEKWAAVLNRLLPPDVRVVRSSAAAWKFHSRFCARSRTYEYRILERSRTEPSRARFVFEGKRSLDTAAMAAAASGLLGEHDFRAFGEQLTGVENASRTIERCTVRRARDEVRIRVEASAFLRGMMRRIAGGLYEIGKGKRRQEDFSALLNPAGRDAVQWPVVLPAKGLTLVSVRYGRTLRDIRDEKPAPTGEEQTEE